MANRSIQNALSDTAIKTAKPTNKAYTMPDGNGLQLLIKPNGKKSWEVRFTIDGKTTKTSIGTYPTVKLKEARDKRDQYKELAYQGINPLEAKREAKRQKESEQKGQFHLIVKEWSDSLACKDITRKKIYRMFERDVFPYFCKYDDKHEIISSQHIASIKHNELLKVITNKKHTAAETAKRIYQESQRLWLYAIAHDYTETLITAKIDKSVLPKPEVKHMPKISDEETLKELLKKIEEYKGNIITRYLLKFVTLIPLRAENLCLLRWEQVDLEKGTLTIARADMKQKDKNLPDFNVLLPHQAIDLLKEVHNLTGWGQWVFHGLRNMHNHINKETANKALRLMGFTDEGAKRKQTLHSFRGTFRSLVETHRQKHNKPFEVMERCLDHHEKNAVARAYSHEADYSEQMGELFQWWSDYLNNMKTKDQS
ncbi:MAG: integrase arm-type DNA-binding domain-containing protein [Campylobacterota bacterium]|nr:integrase arm-type DNA-binding domain-containing protein [Campylobacterota bacterium]